MKIHRMYFTIHTPFYSRVLVYRIGLLNLLGVKFHLDVDWHCVCLIRNVNINSIPPNTVNVNPSCLLFRVPLDVCDDKVYLRVILVTSYSHECLSIEIASIQLLLLKRVLNRSSRFLSTIFLELTLIIRGTFNISFFSSLYPLARDLEISTHSVKHLTLLLISL